MLAAAHHGDIAQLKKLFEQGRRPDYMDNHGWTALHHAAVNGHAQCVNYLLEFCMTEHSLTTLQTHEGETALLLACNRKDMDVDIIKVLLRYNPKSTEIGNNECETPLHKACYYKRSSVVELLVNSGASLNSQDFNGYTPLHVAVEVGCSECTEILLYAGADATLLDEYKRNALQIAFTKKHLSCARMLLDFVTDEDINISFEEGNVLTKAVVWDNKELVELLLSKGADPNIQDDLMMLPVDLAKSCDIARILLNSMSSDYIPLCRQGYPRLDYVPMNIIKLMCEFYPELFLPYGIDYLVRRVSNCREDCVHIIQILLSQTSLENIENHVCIHLSNPNEFVDFLDILEILIFHGQDFHINWALESCVSSILCLHLTFPLDVWSLRAQCCTNPRYSPSLILSLYTYSLGSIDISQIPASWELNFDENKKIIPQVHSLKHLCRCRFRSIFNSNISSSYRNWKRIIKLINLPLSLELYIQYLEGCE